MRIRVRLQAPDDGGGQGGGGDAAAAAAAAAAGGGAAAWFPESHKTLVETKQWKGAGDVIDSYNNLEKLVGADKAGRTVVLPKDEKDAEGIKAFHAKIGVPESPDKYELPKPEGDNGEFSKIAAGWFHANGVPKAAAQGIAKAWNDHIGKIVKDQETAALAASEQQLTELKGTWGAEFEKNSEFAKRFLNASGWDKAKVNLYEQTFGTAQMLKDFHSWGSKTAEPGFAGGEGGGSSFSGSKQAAQAKLDQIRNDRAEGKITDVQWRGGVQAEYEKLAQAVG